MTTIVLPLLPLRDIIVFPHQVEALFVGRERSVAALNDAMANGKQIVLAAQKRAKTNEPLPEEVYDCGTITSIVDLFHLPDGTVKVIVQGKRRCRVSQYTSTEPFFQVRAEELEETTTEGIQVEALARSIRTTFEAYVKLNKRIPPQEVVAVSRTEEPSRLADTVIGHLSLKLSDKQELLEALDVEDRLSRLHETMQSEIEILQVEKKIRTRIKKQMEKTQKEYYLNEQKLAIERELGERDELKNEIQELEDKLAETPLTEEAKARGQTEIKKLKLMPPMSAEATVVRNYIDWLIALPWLRFSDDNLDLDHAKTVLDDDHYGLEKVKDRILEHLAVASLVEKPAGPILCLVGPPGVGKTSLARSVARALGREFVRISLGGVRDEAEIRGHRRTYIGAMPGKIVQSLKRAGSSNPVFLLDEIDKMSTDFRGDPSAALLEVLDPEQNATFVDHYLDLDYDLSRVFFIATANTTMGIPGPLQDRMEIIQLEGYTEPEKIAIAEKYLVPKQRERNGLQDMTLGMSTAALRQIVQRYTREAGVRALERQIASVLRKIARDVVSEGKRARMRINQKQIEKFLGVPKYRPGQTEEKDEVGLATGLAWTQAGGELLTIEAAILPGKGKLIVTGKLGDVMQESAQAAMSYVRSRASLLGLEREFYAKLDIHIHLPEGAMPKDGPSAGITMATALTSALTRIPVRRDVAMTGEITLRGRVLPIGGLKEKALAAHRGGVSTILFPKENEKDLADMPKVVKDEVEMIPVEHMDDVLRMALRLEDPDRFYAQLRGERHVQSRPVFESATNLPQ